MENKLMEKVCKCISSEELDGERPSGFLTNGIFFSCLKLRFKWKLDLRWRRSEPKNFEPRPTSSSYA